MARRIPLPHLVILLPGIMGSVLQHEGRDVWALSGQALTNMLVQKNTTIERLALQSDDLDREVLDDGIRATRLIEEIYDIPGLIKGAGYRTIQRELEHTFALETGDVAAPQPHQNFFPFPYDWRRDIRVNADRLRRFIDVQLRQWRLQSGRRDARVILIAHSMGGLVARVYIELLGGYEHVELLYTLGTPHRGSLNALHTLSNGLEARSSSGKKMTDRVLKRVLNRDLQALSKIVRTFTSVYQLLPIYPVVEQNGELARIADLTDISNIDQARVQAARDLLIRIGEAALARRQADAGAPAPTLPVVGFGQDTAQQAFRREDGQMVMNFDPLPGMLVADGDGTVPHFSAVPMEVQMLNLRCERFVNQHHGWLPNGRHGLISLIADLAYRLDLAHAPTQGDRAGFHQRVLRVHVDDLYTVDEPVIIQAQVRDTPEEVLPLVAHIIQVGGIERRQVVLHPYGNEWVMPIEGLPPGLYQLEVHPQVQTPQGPHSVLTAFEVIAMQE